MIYDYIIKWGIETILGLALLFATWSFKATRTKIMKLTKEQTAISNGTQALLRDRIIQAYNHYMEKGFCPIYGLDAINAMYQEYVALGGNSTVPRLVKELRELPTEKEHNGY